jgi:hypothetical protein
MNALLAEPPGNSGVRANSRRTTFHCGIGSNFQVEAEHVPVAGWPRYSQMYGDPLIATHSSVHLRSAVPGRV